MSEGGKIVEKMSEGGTIIAKLSGGLKEEKNVREGKQILFCDRGGKENTHF